MELRVVIRFKCVFATTIDIVSSKDIKTRLFKPVTQRADPAKQVYYFTKPG